MRQFAGHKAQSIALVLIALSLTCALPCLASNRVFADDEVGEVDEVSAEVCSDADEASYNDVQTPKGLVNEGGKIYFYNDDGTLFTGGLKQIKNGSKTDYYFFQEDGSAFTEGYKVVTAKNTRTYYYFQKDGTAYTDGYLEFTQGGKTYYFFFNTDGTAFTGGYKEITLGGKLYYYYFLQNGQGFNTGYKTVTKDGKKYYYYFGSDGRAVTDSMQTVTFGENSAKFLFLSNGAAFTGGYKEVTNSGKTDYYYFLPNGQSFNTGYKVVTIDGKTNYFFFEKDGTAFTGGLKSVAFGDSSFYYYFQKNGRALAGEWLTEGSNKSYFAANGRGYVNQTATIDGKKYLFDSELHLVSGTGWFAFNKKYYYGNDDGSIITDKIIDCYKLNSDGSCPTKYQILEYVNTIIPNPEGMTDQQKIDALYDWILKNNWVYIRTYEHTKSSWVWKDSWVDDMALSLMQDKGGNCFRYACFLGLLVHEATDLKVVFYHGSVPAAAGGLTPHGWITIYQDGVEYAYDVELNKFSKSYTYAKCHKKVYSSLVNDRYYKGIGTVLA